MSSKIFRRLEILVLHLLSPEMSCGQRFLSSTGCRFADSLHFHSPQRKEHRQEDGEKVTEGSHQETFERFHAVYEGDESQRGERMYLEGECCNQPDPGKKGNIEYSLNVKIGHCSMFFLMHNSEDRTNVHILETTNATLGCAKLQVAKYFPVQICRYKP